MPLNLDLLDLTVGLHQLVTHLQQHSKCQIRFLNTRQHFGFVDIAAGQQFMHIAVRGVLHRVDLTNFVHQHRGKLVAPIDAADTVARGGLIADPGIETTEMKLPEVETS